MCVKIFFIVSANLIRTFHSIVTVQQRSLCPYPVSFLCVLSRGLLLSGGRFLGPHLLRAWYLLYRRPDPVQRVSGGLSMSLHHLRPPAALCNRQLLFGRPEQLHGLSVRLGLQHGWTDAGPLRPGQLLRAGRRPVSPLRRGLLLPRPLAGPATPLRLGQLQRRWTGPLHALPRRPLLSLHGLQRGEQQLLATLQ